MAKYINLESAIAAIRSHSQRVGQNNDFYQLAHDHIIDVLKREPSYDEEEITLYGYRAKDLVIVAERLRKDNIDPIVLKGNNEEFLEGYKHAQAEIKQSLEESIRRIVSRD